MTSTPSTTREPRWWRLHAGRLSLLEIVVLGPLAAFLVLRVIPSTFGIEWECFGEYGRERVVGDSYLAGASVAGTFGWLLVIVGVLYAQIAESRRLVVLLPLVWFLVLVLTSLGVAASMETPLCRS
jgi:hypothetical protein